MPKKKNKDGYFRSTFVIGKDPDGKPKRITIRGKTRKEHDEKLAEARRLHARGISLNEVTVYDWAEKWLNVYKANASDTQKAHYSAKLRNDILPRIGFMFIHDVRHSHLQELLNKHDGGRVGTVQKIRIAIQQLFEDAEVEGIIDRNPARRLELPELEEEARRPITPIERAIAYNVADFHKAGIYVMTMLFCGLRRGECIALRVRDIDLKRPSINVDKRITFNNGNTGEEKEGTKSRAGVRSLPKRVVPIPDLLKPFLAAQCAGKNPGDILFPKDDGKHATRQTVRWWWKSFLRQCHIAGGAKLYRNQVQVETSPFGDEITAHYLRHTFATDMYAAGVDDTTQKIFLGHTSKEVTDRYRKMSDAAFDRALQQLNDYYADLDFTIENNLPKKE